MAKIIGVADLNAWLVERRSAARNYLDLGETKKAAELDLETDDIRKAAEKDPAAQLVIVVELREDKLSKTDKQLLTQVKEDPSARDRFRRWHGADVDDIHRASRRRGVTT
jgi:hypothetical protein